MSICGCVFRSVYKCVYVFVLMSVCVYESVQECVREAGEYVWVCLWAWVYVSECDCACGCVYMWTCVCMWACVCVYVSVCKRECVWMSVFPLLLVQVCVWNGASMSLILGSGNTTVTMVTTPTPRLPRPNTLRWKPCLFPVTLWTHSSKAHTIAQWLTLLLNSFH